MHGELSLAGWRFLKATKYMRPNTPLEDAFGVRYSFPMQPISETVKVILAGLNPLFFAIGLAIVSCTPGPQGMAAVLAAISYDFAHKRWYGVALSSAAMIPIVGYIPAAVKVAVLLLELKRRLNTLVLLAPEIHRSSEALQLVRSALGSYYKRLPNLPPLRSIRRQFQKIMDFDDLGQPQRPAAN